MKKIFVSIMMAFAMLFACVITPFTAPTAKADEATVYDTVYYVSDNPEASSYRQNLLTFPTNAQIDANIENIYLYHNDHFETAFNSFLVDVSTVSNAYVIVEMVAPFTPQVITSATITLADKFYNTFRDLKSADCQILFICGTDETRLLDPDHEEDSKNAFLEYVDYHINTDMLTTYLYNIFYRIEEDINDPPSNVVYILDSYFAEGLNLTVDIQGWFFTIYLFPYLEEVYPNEIASYSTMQEFLTAKNIGIVCYYGTVYINVITGQGIADIGAFLDGFEFIYAIGSSYCLYDNAETTTWGDEMLDMRIDTGKDFPIYILDCHNVWESDLDGDLYTVNMSSDVYSHIVDFLTPFTYVDLYYFWPGLCENTHKHCIIAEVGGWIIDMYSSGYYIGEWKIYTTL